MANPFSRGLASNYYPNTGTFGAASTATPTFGKALYTSTTTTSAGGGANTSNSLAGSGFTTIGQLRAPSYSTVLSADIPIKTYEPAQLMQNIQSLLDRSSFLTSRPNIQVSIEGATVILQGTVQTDKERRLTEGVVRTTPGVREVQNQLQVAQAQK